MLSYITLNIVLFSIDYYYSCFDFIIYTLLTLIPLLLVVAFFTLAERKAMASIQRRSGPNVVGIWGVLQPFADGLKLVLKEIIIPNKANNFLFILAPSFTLFLSFLGWVVISFDLYTKIFNLNNNLLFILVISSFSVHGILLSGWSSNSKYALLGALRSASQMISYEISISLILVPIILLSSSLNINEIIHKQDETCWFILPLLPLAIIFFISILAETNRAPFDLPEAEAELVAGYNVEYSGITFAAFFLGEYANILLMSSLFVIFFLGGGSVIPYAIDVTSKSIVLQCNWFWPVVIIFKGIKIFFLTIMKYGYPSILIASLSQGFVFSVKTIIVTFIFIFTRANLPRFRFDQLMYIGWKIFLPLSLSFVLFYSGVLIAFNGLNTTELPFINASDNFIQSFSVLF
jgi:NADH-quinone oxidoreductase subunit H